MPQSVFHSPKKMPRGGYGKGKYSSNSGYAYRVLCIVLFASLVAGIFFVRGGESLRPYVKDLTVRDILVWLNPAFSEVPEEFLPFSSTSMREQPSCSDSRVSGSQGAADPFMDKDDPFCQTAGHAATPATHSDVSHIPITTEALPSITQPYKPALILPEAPRGIETTVKSIAQIAKGSTDHETGQSQDAKALSDKQKPEHQSGQQRQNTKKSSASSSKEAPNQERQNVSSPRKDTPDWEATPRSEKFQLPGSVLVRIQNYRGTSVRWDLAVILDDSHSMGRQTKSWNTSRFQTAITFVQKLSSTLNPGSKMAVRDFVCGGNKDKKEEAKGCLSRLLIDWTPGSSKQWKDLLEKADHGGATDPCAAAAFSVKRDFHGGSGRKPRLLIITGGAAAPCASSHVVKAIESSETTKGLVVDVLALGLGKKRHKGFSFLAQRTGGVFLEIDRPADVDHSFNKYSKVLQTKVLEKVEIKNEKVSLSFNPHQEMSLAPGTYAVILPSVEGIEPSRRVVPNVKVSSAETTIIDVTIRKGRPVVRIDKKQ